MFNEPAPDPNRPAVEIVSLAQLIEQATAIRTFSFDLNSQRFQVRMRPLKANEAAELDKIDGNIRPPRDRKTDVLLIDDPGYVEAMERAQRVKRVTAIDLAVLSFKVEGGSIEEKVKNLYTQLPPGVIEELWRQILSITGSPIQNGLFTSSADSTNTPS
jgi:hypothetical protein